MGSNFDFDSAVFAYFMEHGKPCTAKDIAEYAGVSIAKVRKAITNNWHKSACVDTYIEIGERSYGSVVANRRVRGFQPYLSQMRERIKELEGVAS